MQPTDPTVPELFKPRTRTCIYVASAVASAAMGVVTVSVDVHWGFKAAWAGWNAFVGLLAASNVKR